MLAVLYSRTYGCDSALPLRTPSCVAWLYGTWNHPNILPISVKCKEGWNRHRDYALPVWSSSYEALWDVTWNYPKTMPTTLTRRDRSFVMGIAGGDVLARSLYLTVTCSVSGSCLDYAGRRGLATWFPYPAQCGHDRDTSSCVDLQTLGLFWEVADTGAGMWRSRREFNSQVTRHLYTGDCTAACLDFPGVVRHIREKASKTPTPTPTPTRRLFQAGCPRPRVNRGRDPSGQLL